MSGIYPSAVLGYRVWAQEDLRLIPLFYQHDAWKPGINLAKCHKLSLHDGRAVKECNCGFHAYHTIRKAGKARSLSPLDLPTILGVIAGRGEIQVHTDGWRAAEAQIIALYRYQPAAEALAEIYAVPLFSGETEIKRLIGIKVSPVPEHLILDPPASDRLFKVGRFGFLL